MDLHWAVQGQTETSWAVLALLLVLTGIVVWVLHQHTDDETTTSGGPTFTESVDDVWDEDPPTLDTRGPDDR